MMNFDDYIESDQFRKIFLPLATLFLIVVFVSLGIWQLDRAAEKSNIQAMFESDAPYARVTGEMPVSEFQNIEANGQYLDRRQVLIDNMFVDGQVGFYVITAFRFAPKEPLLLVNRGWIPHAPAEADLHVGTATRSIRGRAGFLPKVGIRSRETFQAGDEWPKTAFYPTLEDLSREFDEDFLPFVLLLSPDAEDGFLRHWQPRGRGPMMHYGYALQWFAMAAAVAGIFVWRLRKKGT
jgi:surfeit locus 1 family protein